MSTELPAALDGCQPGLRLDEGTWSIMARRGCTVEDRTIHGTPEGAIGHHDKLITADKAAVPSAARDAEDRTQLVHIRIPDGSIVIEPIATSDELSNLIHHLADRLREQARDEVRNKFAGELVRIARRPDPDDVAAAADHIDVFLADPGRHELAGQLPDDGRISGKAFVAGLIYAANILADLDYDC